MDTIFSALPGLEIEIGHINRELASIWGWDTLSPKGGTSEFRASQMNLILHLGHDTDPADARHQLDQLVSFSHRYPCRGLVLCPRAETGDTGGIQAKLFCECYIGKSRHEMSCCEVISLSYGKNERQHLENQVSTLLEGDLPIYYWVHRFCSPALLRDYRFFLQEAQRVIFDSAVEKSNIRSLAWPERTTLRDLADARLLPIRQILGQFLSSFRPEQLADMADRISVRTKPAWEAEGVALLRWMKLGLAACGDSVPETGTNVETCADLSTELEVSWLNSAGEPLFQATIDVERKQAWMQARIDGRDFCHVARIQLLAPRQALAEALFFDA